MITCTKRYSDIPFAHRQHSHTGHCRFIHGHNWGFEFTFVARTLDVCGFVIDFGDLKWLKAWLNATFDHKLVLNADDPFRGYIISALVDAAVLPAGPLTSGYQFADIIVLPDASCEGLARYVFEKVNAQLSAQTGGRVLLRSLTVFEDEKNSATFAP